MFYNLNNDQINKIKARFYPQELVAGEFLKSVTVNSYGSDNPDNSVKITYSIKDGLASDPATEEPEFRVFNNEQAKKYLKLKIFEISNSAMLASCSAVERSGSDVIRKLEGVINKYGALSYDFTPSLDFVGDKNNQEVHRISVYNNAIELVYNTTFLLPRPNINYLSLGAIFYFDKNQYISDQKIEERFIDERILFDKLNVYKLYENNVLVMNPAPPVQDLRLLKSVFKENAFLDNLSNIINSNYAYTNVLNAKRYAESQNVSSNTSEFQNLIKDLSEVGSGRPKYFSNAYFSRNSNKSLGLVFSLDYQQILEDNSVYAKLLFKSDIKEEFINKCKISSIKVMRRVVTTTVKNKFIPRHESKVNIVSSGEPKGNNTVSDVEETNGTITEIVLSTNSSLKTRTFAITDKNVFAGMSGLYQYGVEIAIIDGINQFLGTHVITLLSDLTKLKNYLEETNKIVKINSEDKYGYSANGSYDPRKNSFTTRFIENFDEKIISDAAANFTSTLSLLGLLKKSSEELTASISSMLHPVSASAETISYFIRIYEKLIAQINKTIHDNINNNFKIEHWFVNDYADTTSPIKVGYKFMDMTEYRGIGVLDFLTYGTRVNSEQNRYSYNPNIDSTEYTDTQYSYLSPNTIFSKNKILSLENLNTNPDAVSNMEFVELEIDIKNANNFGFSHPLPPPVSAKNDVKGNRKYNISANANVLTKLFSSTIKNSYNVLPDDSPIKQIAEAIKNDKVVETHLMLAMSKQYDLVKKTFFKAVTANNTIINRKDLLAETPTTNNDIKKEPYNKESSTAPPRHVNPLAPLHVNLLLDDKCILLNAADDYKKSLDTNSKFQFLFNTLHSVEVLEYDSSTFDERWILLTKQKIASLSSNSFYLCRLRNYKNPAYGIEGMDQIKLPIYDQYFFFSDPQSNFEEAISRTKNLAAVKKTKKIDSVAINNNKAINTNKAINLNKEAVSVRLLGTAAGGPRIPVAIKPTAVVNPFSRVRTNINGRK